MNKQASPSSIQRTSNQHRVSSPKLASYWRFKESLHRPREWCADKARPGAAFTASAGFWIPVRLHSILRPANAGGVVLLGARERPIPLLAQFGAAQCPGVPVPRLPSRRPTHSAGVRRRGRAACCGQVVAKTTPHIRITMSCVVDERLAIKMASWKGQEPEHAGTVTKKSPSPWGKWG